MTYQKLTAIRPWSHEGGRCSFIRKDALCLHFTISPQKRCQTLKRLRLLQRKLLNASCFSPWHFPVSCQGEHGPRQLHAGQTPISMLLMSAEWKDMKQSRLIETKSAPCLCELPFSWLKTLTVDNYSAGVRQSLKLMCNHKSEADIKENLTVFWFT